MIHRFDSESVVFPIYLKGINLRDLFWRRYKMFLENFFVLCRTNKYLCLERDFLQLMIKKYFVKNVNIRWFLSGTLDCLFICFHSIYNCLSVDSSNRKISLFVFDLFFFVRQFQNEYFTILQNDVLFWCWEFNLLTCFDADLEHLIFNFIFEIRILVFFIDNSKRRSRHIII